MLVADASEFQLIEMLTKTLGVAVPGVDQPHAPGIRLTVAIGDDAAAWETPAGTTVMTTDTLVEDVHFRLTGTSWRDLGWKALAVNLSDVAAMGCAPLHSAVTLGLRGDLPVEGISEIYQGMLEASGRYGGAVVGGDIVRSPAFFVTVAMVGIAPSNEESEPSQSRLLTRASARPGDKIAVTGSLGCSGGGLRLSTQDGGHTGLRRLGEGTATHLRDAHNRPSPRVTEGMLLARRGVLAAIDISDGLVEDLRKLCEASGVGARVEADLVPADDSLKEAYPEDWLSLALTGGEDYELLFTAPPHVMREAASLPDVLVSVIGDVVSEPAGVTVLDWNGQAVVVGQGGWDHFRDGSLSAGES